MPFDGQNYQTNTTADVLRRARARIDTPDKLCACHLRKNDQHCTIGAFGAVGAYPSDALDFFVKANGFLSRADVMMGNDMLIALQGVAKAHPIIMGWFDKAIALAEAES